MANASSSVHSFIFWPEPTVSSNEATSEQESRLMSTRNEAVSAIGHANPRFNSYSGWWLLVLRVAILVQAVVKAQL